jgi:DNA polymerase I
MEKLYIIDGSSYIYRAFYGLGRFSNSKGLPTQAIYGFATMLAKIVREKQPDFLCVAFDTPGPTFRHGQFREYKATRQCMPEDLIVQIPYIKQLVQLNGIPQLELDGYEADDLIATLALRAVEHDIEVVIVSADKDLHQLIRDPIIQQWDPQRDRVFDEAMIEEKMGVKAVQVRDYLALLGDSSDNIPGVKGVGEKTARQLIQQWGSLDAIYSNLDAVGPASVKKKLVEGKESAYLSRELVTLQHEVPVEVEIQQLRPVQTDNALLRGLYTELEFRSLLEGLPEGTSLTSAHPAGAVPNLLEDAFPGEPVQLLSSSECLSALHKLTGSTSVPIEVVAAPGPAMRSSALGVAFSPDSCTAGYVALDRQSDGSGADCMPELKDALSEFLSRPDRSKAGQDLKSTWIVLRRRGYGLEGIGFDIGIAGYLLGLTDQARSLERMAAELAVAPVGPLVEDKTAETRAEPRAETSCRATALIGHLVPVLESRLQASGLRELFETIEMPLVSVLAEMEYHGILLEGAKLDLLSRDFQKELERKKAVIYDLAKEEFNIQSPKQLAAILFDKLELRVVKKTKSGPSTDIRVLEELALEHPLPEQILAYRSLAKLKSTYIDTLPSLIHPETGRIHTTFNQTVTATGRLSSSDPNLQNIPIRSEEGRKIRAAFTAAPGCVLLSADYSQIELRILAHCSRDAHLVEAFETDSDVHRHTAAEMLNIPPMEVSPEMRRQAKMINFGIIYGMSAYGLAQRLHIPPKLARTAIERYFERYRGVRAYIDDTVLKARAAGYCETLLGRRRFIPEIQSRNRTIQQQGERLAVNTPIQGTAADLIKKAMIDISRELKRRRLKTAMILQVHDELVFEVPQSELELVKSLIRNKMEGAQPLLVPLKVEMGWGSDWAQAHP